MSCYSTGNTGRKYCVAGTIYDRPTGFIFADRGHTQTAANFLLEATWLTGIKSQLLYPVIGEEIVKNVTDSSSDVTLRTYENDTEKLVKRGKYKYMFTLEVNECLKKKLIYFDGFTEGVYFTYGEAIRGRTIDSGINVVPIRVSMTIVDKEKLLTTGGEGGTVDIIIQLENQKDLNLYDYGRVMSWEPEDLDGLTEVDLTLIGTASATTVVVDVTSTCYGNTKAIAGLGLTSADWVVENGTVVSAVESSTIPGRYTITGTTFATGTFNLAAPSVPRSDDVLVISSGTITITVA